MILGFVVTQPQVRDLYWLTMPNIRRVTLLALVTLPGVACIPYTVGSTARTVPPGAVETASMVFVVPNAFESAADSASGRPLPGVDGEARWGIDDRSDIGARITSASGIVVNYKHRIDSEIDDTRRAFAFTLGAGFVNAGQHALGEATFLASAGERNITPYGGLRIMHTLPLSSSAASDTPTIGGFAGAKFGNSYRGVSIEMGVYYDESALRVRRRNVVFVPAIVLHGDVLPLIPSWPGR